MPKYRKSGNNPLFVFFMQLDTDQTVIRGMNRGRLLLCDERGLIGRWVCSSSVEPKQNTSWNERGGIIPPTASMPANEYWQLHTKRIFQPGQPVDDGFLITFRGKTTYTTVEGGTRSEIMLHDDVNRNASPGSLGCIVTLSKGEWDDLCLGIKESVGHVPMVNLLVAYCY